MSFFLYLTCRFVTAPPSLTIVALRKTKVLYNCNSFCGRQKNGNDESLHFQYNVMNECRGDRVKEENNPPSPDQIP